MRTPRIPSALWRDPASLRRTVVIALRSLPRRVSFRDVDDVAQDVMILLWKVEIKGVYDWQRSSPNTLTHIVALNYVRGRIRRAARRAQIGAENQHRFASEERNDEDALSRVIRLERLSALRKALSELAAKQPATVRCLRLRYFDGLSNRDAAEVAGISVGTCESHVRNGKVWLRELLCRADRSSG